MGTITPVSGADLASVSCVSVNFCIAVGASYQGTLAEEWNGSAWSMMSTTNPLIYDRLYGVSCATVNFCVAVGEYNNGATAVTLAEEWDGSAWSTMNIPNPSGTFDYLTGVSCTSAIFCMAVGHFDTDYTHQDHATIAEEWNGTAWSITTTINPITSFPYDNNLDGVSCTSATSCLAVGSEGSGISGGAYQTLAEEWNGSVWATTPTMDPILSDGLFAVACQTGSSCIAVGSDNNSTQTLAEAWNGLAWSALATTDPAAPDVLTGVSCTVTGFCVAAGSANNGTQTLAESYGQVLPTSVDQCKNGGWQTFGVFANQGDCVSFVATKSRNPPDG